MFGRHLFILILAGLTVLCSAAEAAPQLKSRLSSESVSVEETVTLKVEILWRRSEGDYGFTVPDIPAQNLELLRRGESQEVLQKRGEPWEKKTFVFEWQPLAKGPAELGPFDIGFLLKSEPVADLAPGAELPHRDPDLFTVEQYKLKIRPAPFRIQNYLIPLSAGLVVVVVLVVILGRKRAVRRKEAEQEPPVQERYLKRIESLGDETRSLSSKEMLQQLSVELKAFVVEFYGLDRRQGTESEILASLKAKEVRTEEISALERHFERIHVMKFSGERLDWTEMRRFHDEIVGFVKGKRVLGKTPA